MWQTILAKRNREIIGFVGAGVAAILAGAWAIFVYVLPPEPTKQSVPPTNIIAGCSVVSGGSISTTSIDVKCGPSAAEIEVLVSKLVSKQDLMDLIKSVRDQSAFDRKMMTDLSTKVGLTQAQLASIIDTLSKEAIGPGDVFAKFALATRDYIDISIGVCKSFRLNPQKQSSKVFILVQDSPGYRRAAELQAEGITASGGSLIRSEKFPENTTDFSTYLVQVGQSEAGQLVVCPDRPQLTIQATEFGVIPRSSP